MVQELPPIVQTDDLKDLSITQGKELKDLESETQVLEELTSTSRLPLLLILSLY